MVHGGIHMMTMERKDARPGETSGKAFLLPERLRCQTAAFDLERVRQLDTADYQTGATHGGASALCSKASPFPASREIILSSPKVQPHPLI